MADENPAEAVTESQVESDESESQEQEKPEAVPGWANKLMSKMRGKLTRSDKRMAQLTDALKQATDKLAQVEGNTTAAQKKDVETNLRTLRKKALADGDADAFDEIDARLQEVRAMRVAPKKIDIPDIAPESEVDDEDRDAVDVWADKRPWAKPSHDLYDEAAHIGASVFGSKRFKDKPIEDKLAEIDRRMSVLTGKATDATVLSGNGGGSKVRVEPKLTEQDKKLAKLWYGDMADGDEKKANEMWLAAKKKAPKSNLSGVVGNG